MADDAGPFPPQHSVQAALGGQEDDQEPRKGKRERHAHRAIQRPELLALTGIKGALEVVQDLPARLPKGTVSVRGGVGWGVVLRQLTTARKKKKKNTQAHCTCVNSRQTRMQGRV